METIQEILRALGMTLVHSVWQGAIIAAIIMLLLLLISRNNARARYALHFTGLMALLGSFIVTFIIVLRNHQSVNDFQQAFLSLPEGDLIQAFPVTEKGFLTSVLIFLEPYAAWLAFFWLAGFVITAIRMTGGAITARILFQKDLIMPDDFLTELFTSLKTSLRIPSDVKLRISNREISPMVTGILAPLVIIPAAAVTGMSCDQLRSILIHELAHIRRHDPVFVVIQAFARLVLFFHPLAWYLFREIDRERENCCDDLVIRNNNSPINYIKALAMIQELNISNAGSNALTGRSNQLLSRIKRLLKPETQYSTKFRMTVITMAVMLIGTISMAFIITEHPDVKSADHAGITPDSREEIKTAVIQDNRDGDKKKMVIIFSNDTIKEITVNGKKLSREEMKEYAEDIRKVQRELENSQEELKRAHGELEHAQRQLELAQRELHTNHLNEQINRELALKNFNFEFNDQQWKNKEFQESMKRMQEEAWNALRNGQNSLEYLNSEEFKEQMKKAQEELREALEKNRELFDSEEFRKEMRKASDAARDAFEELRHSHRPPMPPPAPGFDHQEPPAPRHAPDARVPEIPDQPEVQKGEIPVPPEAPQVDEDIDVDEQIEAESEVEHEADSGDNRSREMDEKLRELELE